MQYFNPEFFPDLNELVQKDDISPNDFRSNNYDLDPRVLSLGQYSTWRTENLRNEDGVLVGADQTQEWILPWWWDHYCRNNSKPVAFIDFGMSFEKKAWCRERGELVPLRVLDFATEKDAMQSVLVEEFEKSCGKCFWDSRNAWFKKPFGCLQSPFKTSLWVDLDCEIRGSLDPLFEFEGFAMAKDQIALESPHQIYNSGVVVFRKGLKIIEKWADRALKQNDLFRGDQELLSWLIDKENFRVTELPPTYNWSRSLGDNPNAHIFHWHGSNGKKIIRHELNIWNMEAIVKKSLLLHGESKEDLL